MNDNYILALECHKHVRHSQLCIYYLLLIDINIFVGHIISYSKHLYELDVILLHFDTGT